MCRGLWEGEPQEGWLSPILCRPHCDMAPGPVGRDAALCACLTEAWGAVSVCLALMVWALGCWLTLGRPCCCWHDARLRPPLPRLGRGASPGRDPRMCLQGKVSALDWGWAGV